jgi:hypothetical protein
MNKLAVWVNYPKTEHLRCEWFSAHGAYLVTDADWPDIGSTLGFEWKETPFGEALDQGHQSITNRAPGASIGQTFFELPYLTGQQRAYSGDINAVGLTITSNVPSHIFASGAAADEGVFFGHMLWSEEFISKVVSEVTKVILERFEEGDIWTGSTPHRSFNFADWCLEHKTLFNNYPNKYVAVDVEREEVVLAEEDGLTLARKVRDLEHETKRTYRTFNTRAYANILVSEDN